MMRFAAAASLLCLTVAHVTTPRAHAQGAGVESVPCQIGQVEPGVRCGVLVTRAVHDGGDAVVRIAYAFFPSIAARAPTDPIVILPAVPGTLSGSFDGIGAFVRTLSQRRDVIVLMHRGGSWSQPRLTCNGPGAAVIGDTISDMILAQCADQIRSVPLPIRAFTSREWAADLRDLRQALNITSWNVVAASRSARTARIYLGLDAAAVRSMILVSPMIMPGETIDVERPARRAAALRRFGDRCVELGRCSPTREGLRAVVARIEALDVMLPAIGNTRSEQRLDLRTASRLFEFYWRTGNVPSGALRLNTTLQQVANGDRRQLTTLTLMQSRAQISDIGRNYAIDFAFECQEDWSLERTAAFRRAEAEHQPIAGSSNWAEILNTICPRLVGSDPRSREPPAPAVFQFPLLVVRGGADAVTSPDTISALRRDFPRYAELEFAGYIDREVARSECVTYIVGQFVAGPTATLDVECVARASIDSMLTR